MAHRDLGPPRLNIDRATPWRPDDDAAALERTEYIPIHEEPDPAPRRNPMTTPHEPEPLPRLDARNRAVRTFFQGLLAAVLAAVVPVLLGVTGQIRWTREYWIAVGVAVANAALIAVIAYVARFTHPPNP